MAKFVFNSPIIPNIVYIDILKGKLAFKNYKLEIPFPIFVSFITIFEIEYTNGWFNGIYKQTNSSQK